MAGIGWHKMPTANGSGTLCNPGRAMQAECGARPGLSNSLPRKASPTRNGTKPAGNGRLHPHVANDQLGLRFQLGRRATPHRGAFIQNEVAGAHDQAVYSR